MIVCPKCAHQNEDTALTCPNCGHILQLSSQELKQIEARLRNTAPPFCQQSARLQTYIGQDCLAQWPDTCRSQSALSDIQRHCAGNRYSHRCPCNCSCLVYPLLRALTNISPLQIEPTLRIIGNTLSHLRPPWRVGASCSSRLYDFLSTVLLYGANGNNTHSDYTTNRGRISDRHARGQLRYLSMVYQDTVSSFRKNGRLVRIQ
ncbi:MAG: zinc ribbon domain-containing protein [Candidatus Omnitrophica bacterium]|nr:zinc ribbon domain-containing protein [Candidatus Omnitrophota bacterium]